MCTPPDLFKCTMIISSLACDILAARCVAQLAAAAEPADGRMKTFNSCMEICFFPASLIFSAKAYDLCNARECHLLWA